MTKLLTNEFPLSDADCQAMQIDKQEAHVAWLILFSESGAAAIVRAGYKVSLENAELTWNRLTLRPSYARAVEVMTRHFLQAIAAPAALAVQFDLLTSKNTAPGIKHQIGKTLMEMAGYGQESGPGGKPVDLDKLDASTLDALIQDLEARKAGLAKNVTVSGDSGPVSEPDNSQLLELL